MTDKEVMQEALDALDKISMGGDPRWADNVIPALRAALAQPEPLPAKSKGALSHEENKRHNQIIIDKFYEENAHLYKAQPEQEPVAWWHDRGDVVDLNVSRHGTPLYFAPPQREWQGLTDEEVMSLLPGAVRLPPGWTDTVRAIEAKLKEKNT